jgi:hypothetical protein
MRSLGMMRPAPTPRRTGGRRQTFLASILRQFESVGPRGLHIVTSDVGPTARSTQHERSTTSVRAEAKRALRPSS